jgi:3-mercaptopyruvate sulfurtransferase SseA
MLINLLAALVILARASLVVSHQCAGTPLRVRAAWILVAVGAAAVMLAGGTPTWPNVALHSGIAVLVCLERRATFFCEKK